jgi:hypothetical protein
MALADFFTRPSSEAPSEGGLSPDLADRLEQAKAAYLKQYGKPMPITSGFRTKEEQQRLFDQRKNNPNLVAQPGTSLHETGNAVDIGTSVPEAFLNQFGIHRPLGKKDPVHAVLMPSQAPSEGGLASFFTRPEGEQALKEKDVTKPFVGYRPMRRGGVAEAQQPTSPEAQQANQERGKESNFLRDLALGGASLADQTIGGILPQTGQVVQAVTRPFTTPERAAQMGQAVTSTLENPFGKTLGALGVGQGTESPAYKQELLRSTMEAFAKNGIEPTAEAIAQKTGLPLPDVQNMLNTAMVGIAPTVGKYGAKGVNLAREVAGDVRSQMQQQMAAKQAQVQPTTQPSGMQSAGAAAAMPENVLRGNIDAALAQASPELQAHIQSKNPRAVDLPALETRSLEEKHGINLSRGQRTGDTSLYSQEWNKRGETSTLGEHFNEQPKQFKNAFENSIRKNAPDINETDPSAIGQVQINALAAKDQIRKTAISEAYKALEDANGGQFPIDISKLKQNIDSKLKSKLKYNAYEDKLSTIKKDIDSLMEKGHMTFADFENLRTNLADELRSNGNGTARQAAYIVRDQLENLPIFGEETGSPQAIQLKALADTARSLNKERMDVIKSNPAYKAAVKEASTLEDAAAQGESLNAEKFHDKFVTKGTPESIRRMKAELANDPQAMQAMVAGELRNAMRKAGLATDTPDLNPKTLANYIHDNKGRLQEALGPQGMQDLMELTALSSKVGMPKTGTFNYSNTFSGMLGEMAKQGMSSAAEAKLAAMTGGASIPAVSLGKSWMQKLNKEGFAREAVNPYGGLTKD